MKRTWTKAVVVALSCMMTFMLAACGGGGGESADAGGNTLKVGVIGPFTGPAAIYGNAVKNGAELAVKEINEANPDGVQIEMFSQDDEHDAEKSVNAFNKLMDDGMQVLVGPTTSGPATAVATEADTKRVFMLTPSGSDPNVVDGHDNAFQLCFSDPNQGTKSAEYMAENFADAKVGVIYKNDDPYSTGIYNKFKSEWEAQGKNVVADATFSEGVTDFSAQLTKMKDAGADLVFLPIYYDAASTILKQANDMGYAPKFFGCDGMDGILAMEGFDTKLAEGLMLLTPFTPYSEDEKSKAFTEAYQAAYNEVPIQFAADAYDCVYAVYDAFAKTGLNTNATADEICEEMITVFTGDFTASGITGESMKWEANGEVEKEPKVCAIEDGKYVEK